MVNVMIKKLMIIIVITLNTFFKNLYPEASVKKMTKALVAVQDDLGRLNDVAVCRSLLKDLRVSAALEPDFNKPLTERALGVVSGWQASSLAQRKSQVGPLWAAFKRVRPFWS